MNNGVFPKFAALHVQQGVGGEGRRCCRICNWPSKFSVGSAGLVVPLVNRLFVAQCFRSSPDGTRLDRISE